MKELTTQLEKALKDYGDNCPLIVANPQPAAWSPPAVKEPNSQAATPGSNARKGKRKKAKAGE